MSAIVTTSATQAERNSDEDAMFISPSTMESGSQQWRLDLARRLRHPDGSFAGVIVAGLPISALGSFYRMANVGSQGIIAVVGMERGEVRMAVGPGPIEPWHEHRRHADVQGDAGRSRRRMDRTIRPRWRRAIPRLPEPGRSRSGGRRGRRPGRGDGSDRRMGDVGLCLCRPHHCAAAGDGRLPAAGSACRRPAREGARA